jgi:pyrroloquinoline-quinone synthase
MDSDQVREIIAGALDGRRLLEHPFYRRWESGELADTELGSYAEQYRFAERALPDVLRAVHGGLPDGAAADLVEANLADEVSVPEPHIALFESFAAAVSARSEAPAGPAVSHLVTLELSTAATDPVRALAILASYEVQSAEIATTKSAGLTEHYGVDRAGTRFWDVHAQMEQDHADWAVEALGLLATDPTEIRSAAVSGAEAWWHFLDEREAMAPAPA